MIRTNLKIIALTAAAFVAGTGAYAVPLQFSLSGPQEANFVLDSDPTTVSGFLAESNRFEINNYDAGLGAFPTNTADNLGTIYFFLASSDGGFNLLDPSSNDQLTISTFGPQLFTGTTSNPTFSTGVFSLANGNDSYSLSITEIQPIPLPATALLLLGGLLGLGSFARRKRA